MKILLKTKDELLKEGWTINDSGSLENLDIDDNMGYFSYWFTNLLGKELEVIDYLRDFYIVEGTFLLQGLYVPKCIVKETIE